MAPHNLEMLICPKNKFIFFKPVKCAGTSIEFAFSKCTDENALITGSTVGGKIEYPSRNNLFIDEFGNNKIRFHTHTWPELFFSRILNKEMYSGYKIITAVRNPWETLVSYYWYLVSNQKDDAKREYLTIRNYDPAKEIQDKFKNVCLTPGLFPIEIVSEIGCLNGQMSSLEYLLETNSRFVDEKIDFYIKYEKLEKDFKEACAILDLGEINLPRFKTKQRASSLHYSEYYSDEMKNLVQNNFSKIINTFEYDFKN